MHHELMTRFLLWEQERQRQQEEAGRFPRVPRSTSFTPPLTRSVRALLACLFLVNFGYFTVMPLLAVYLTAQLHFTAAEVGTVMALAVGLQKALSLPAGLLADRVNRKAVLLAGLALRVLGYALFAFSLSFPSLLVAAAVSGLGGALFGPPVKALLAEVADPGERQRLFALRQLLGNLGVTLAPLCAALAVLADPRAAFGLGSALHAVALLLAWRWIAGGRSQTNTAHPAQVLCAVASSRPLLLLGGAVAAFMLLFSQLNVLLPLRTHALALEAGFPERTASSLSGTVLLVNGITVIAAQLGLLRFLSGGSSRCLFQWGTLGVTLGLLLALQSSTLPGLLVGVVVFSLGEVLVFPALDDLTSEYAPPGALATAFGFSSVAWALGGSAGSYLGVQLARSGDAGPEGTWVSVLIVLIGITALLLAPRPQKKLEQVGA